MIKFIRRLFLVSLPLIGVFCITFVWSIYKISSGNYFSIPPHINSVILGHSHSACAFNDSLINGFINLSQHTEGYPYSYFKAKKILEENPNIKNIFIEYTNNQISPWAINRISGIYLDSNIPRMFPVLSKRFIIKSIYKSSNLNKVSNSIIWTYRNNLQFLLNGDNYLYEFWHSHKTPTHIFNSDSTKHKVNLNKKFVDIYSIEAENISYLFKIKELCKEYNVNLAFIRSPLPSHIVFSNEEVYKNIKDIFFPEIPLIDFKNFPLSLNCFADDQHVNLKGREIISTFFNEELLQSRNKDSVYDNIIQQARTHNILYK